MHTGGTINKTYDVVVVGGGMSGVCAAIASARHGARTALVHNRPVLGGNASSEIRMHICGADCHGNRTDARETGIIEEILLENRQRNPHHSFSIFDTVLWEKVKFQEGLDLYLNTEMLEVYMKDAQIKSITAFQLTTEKTFEFEGNIFIDCTGDGYLAFKAGADYRYGRESKSEFGERDAPEMSDSITMGNTLMFKSVDTGAPVRFQKPVWAYTFNEEDLAYRGHSVSISSMEHYGVDSGYWWIELGGKQNVIADGEEIRDELLKTVYGVWDHIKNSGDHGAENYTLDWVQFLPGKRESRRIMGDYILKEQDLLEGRIFDDAVAYGGWPMDMHSPEGFKYKGEPTNFIELDQLYSIPYRCYYSVNIKNLMMAGRNISTTHMAFGSVRVMGTCSLGGQAVGTAAAMVVEKRILPGDMLQHIKELQLKLVKDDCYIPCIENTDVNRLDGKVDVTCSSSIEGCECGNVVNGITRKIGNKLNCWVSGAISENGEWLCIYLKDEYEIGEINIKFDSNLSGEIMPTLSKVIMDKQVPGIPPELVKDYEVQILNGSDLKESFFINNNYQRFRKHMLEQKITGDTVKIIVRSTHGDIRARIFEVGIY